MLHSILFSYEKYSYTPFIVFASIVLKTANRKTILIQAMRESTCNEMLFNVTTLQNIHAIPLSSLFFFYDEPLNPRLKCKILKDRSISRFLESRERERGREKERERPSQRASKSHPRQCRVLTRVATWYELERGSEWIDKQLLSHNDRGLHFTRYRLSATGIGPRPIKCKR